MNLFSFENILVITIAIIAMRYVNKRYKRQIEKIKAESTPNQYSNVSGTSKKELINENKNTGVTGVSKRKENSSKPNVTKDNQNKKKTDSTQKKSESENEEKYTFDDPDFYLLPIVPDEDMLGEVIAEHGDAIYGNDQRYYKDLYIGRVSKGAVLQLMDRRVYKSQYELDIIKVLVLENEWKEEINRIGWVGLTDTSFVNQYNGKTRMIEL